MNLKRINGTVKKKEVVDVLREGNFELLVLTETKLKVEEVSCVE